MADVSPMVEVPVTRRLLSGQDYLRLATDTLRQARQLPVGPERNEIRQIALSLLGLARGTPIPDSGDPTPAP